jgi:GTPase-associated protein 1, N-terminal domain type 2/GTPase-associated protein 1, middle domain
VSTRYGQLTYTSFDAFGSFERAGSAGGWQVKQSSGELSADETQWLVSGIRTAFRPVEPLPDYPSPQELDAAPRRLAYRRWVDREVRGGGYWHTAPAGADSTGRPGNVFAHVLLDRTPDPVPSAPPLRPIQRWRSPSWLRPYGAAAVGGAVLPPDAPGDGQVVTKDSVVAFALDTSTWRLGTLLGLLDAVAAALAGGPPVILGVTSVDSAAQWIGLVSFLMSPGTAAMLNFSTFDRADQLGPALEAGQHLSAVPVTDLSALPIGVLAIDETATLSLGELGGQPHVTAAGQRIEVTAWSVMAQEALLDPQSARAVLHDLDGHAAQTEDRGLHPAWPLAVAIASDETFAGAHPEAHAVLTAHTPDGVSAGSPAALLVDEVVSALIGETTADAWKVAEQKLQGSVGEYAELTYLCRALDDDTWLDQLGPIPVGENSFRDRPVAPRLAAALDAALERSRTSGGPQRALKLVDLLMRAGLDDTAHDRLTRALTEQVAPQLADPHAGPILARRFAHRLGAETRIAAAAATLRTAGYSDGDTSVSDAVLDWFADGSLMPTPEELLRAQPWDATWTRAAVRGIRAERSARTESGSTAEVERFAQLWWLAASGSTRRDDLAAERVWDPAELSAAGGAAFSSAALLPTLVGAPNTDELVRLADEVLTANTDDLAVACAVLRTVDPATWVQHGYIDSHQQTYAPLWDIALAEIPAARVHPDVAVRLAAVAAVAVIAGQPRPVRAGQLAADPAVAAAAADEVVALVEQQVIGAPAVLAASLLGADADAPDAVDAADGLVTVLAEAAGALTAAGYLTEDDEEGVLAAMVQMAGNTGEAPRRYRKLVHTMLAQRGDARPARTARAPLATRMRRNH